MVEGSGPSLSTETTISPGASSARSMRSTSTGGASPRRRSAGPERTIQARSAARATSGRAPRASERRVSRRTAGLLDLRHRRQVLGLEHPHPAELGELALVGVEHELAGVAEGGLQDGPLALAE